MEYANAETAADLDALREALPPASGDWTRTDDVTGTVEYRLPSDDTPCTAAKLTVRPALLDDGAVRLDRTVDCHDVGVSRFDTVDDAVSVVARELDRAVDDADEA